MGKNKNYMVSFVQEKQTLEDTHQAVDSRYLWELAVFPLIISVLESI